MLGLDSSYLCTKFDDCSCGRSRDMVGDYQSVNGSHNLTTPTSGTLFVIRGLALPTVNPYAKFDKSDVRTSICYEHM